MKVENVNQNGDHAAEKTIIHLEAFAKEKDRENADKKGSGGKSLFKKFGVVVKKSFLEKF